MGISLARQSAVAVMLARSPKETLAGVMAGSASTPHAPQLLVRSSEIATLAKEMGAIAAVTNLMGEITSPD